MSIEDIYDPEIPLECNSCSKCSAVNWFEGPHPCIISLNGTEAVRCWRCKFVFWGSDYHRTSNFSDIENVITEDGHPDPMIPLKVLETLTDAVSTQRDMLMISIKKEHGEYDEIVKELRHLENCANYMQRLLVERETKPNILQSAAPF